MQEEGSTGVEVEDYSRHIEETIVTQTRDGTDSLAHHSLLRITESL